MADLGTKQLSSNFGPQPGDDLTREEKAARIRAACPQPRVKPPSRPYTFTPFEPKIEVLREDPEHPIEDAVSRDREPCLE